MAFEDESPASSVPAALPGAAPEPRPSTVLLIEDDAGDALLVREMLEDSANGSGPAIASVWAQSLSAARPLLDASVDCVLLDLGLPDASGLGALTEVLGFSGEAAVVVLTGLEDKALGTRSVELGAQDYLTKGTVDAEGLSRSIRYAIERKRAGTTRRHLREAELRRAENARLQRGLLPRPLIRRLDLGWATRYAPGGGQSLLGGDFYDAVELDDGTVRLVVGDVCGHGPDEAAVGVAMRVAWRSLVVAGVPPDQLLHRLERVLELERHVDDLFTTVCDVVLLPDLAGAEVRVAGHPAPLRIDETLVGSQPLDERGPPLGMFRDAEWNANEVDLGTDWTWLLYTDGLIEGRDGTSEERLADVGLARLALEALPQASDLGDLADRLRRDAERANGGELSDDVAMCLLSPAARWRR